jgi:hypothetical protein
MVSREIPLYKWHSSLIWFWLLTPCVCDALDC